MKGKSQAFVQWLWLLTFRQDVYVFSSPLVQVRDTPPNDLVKVTSVLVSRRQQFLLWGANETEPLLLCWGSCSNFTSRCFELIQIIFDCLRRPHFLYQIYDASSNPFDRTVRYLSLANHRGTWAASYKYRFTFEVILTVHHHYYVEIKCQLDATDDIIYCRFYCMLNMFRTILCPSSGARGYYTDGRCLWYLVLWFSGCRYGVELEVMCPVCRLLLKAVGILFPHI